MSAVLSPSRAHDWKRARRYAVPGWMIDAATERRLAGDWRGACAAASMDIQFDLAEIATRNGAETAAALEDDLRYLAPDLLRWHLPRHGGRSTLWSYETQVLVANYPGQGVLLAQLPSVPESPQRVTLRFGPDTANFKDDLRDHREFWDTRRSEDLLARAGGHGRLPFFALDGRRLHPDEAGADDVLGAVERSIQLQDEGKFEEACAAVGLTVDLGPLMHRDVRDWNRERTLRALRALPANLGGLADAAREAMAVAGGAVAIVRFEGGAGQLAISADDVVRVSPSGAPALKDSVAIPPASWQRPIDFDLVRLGHLGLDALHPLVRRAFFPAAPDAPRAPEHVEPPERLRVKCGAEWHWVGMRDGEFEIPHSPEEHRRELTLRGLGGRPLTGCFAARQGWREHGTRLPKALRLQRRDLVLHFAHGDGPGVARLLDAGLDPHMRTGDGRTLLHLLHLLPDANLLTRLLDAGLDLEARDTMGRTPLHVAIALGGVPVVIEALLDAGANPRAVDNERRSALALADRYRRTDLRHLTGRLT